MAYPITGAPTSYNANLSDFCRADDAFPSTSGRETRRSSQTIRSSTYAPTTFDISCWDASAAQQHPQLLKQLVIGYDNPALYNAGGQAGGPGLFLHAREALPIGTINRNNNIYYGIRASSFSCPTGYSGELCVNPGSGQSADGKWRNIYPEPNSTTSTSNHPPEVPPLERDFPSPIPAAARL